MSMMRLIKRCILKSRIPPCGKGYFLYHLLSYGKWLRDHPAPVHFDEREDLYKHVSEKLDGKSFDYLEAGVFQGDSMRAWTKLSDDSGTRFFGFDTFTGLPEDWQTGLKIIKEGHFDVKGEFPDIDDSRIKFIKGRFQETLSGFLKDYQPQDNIVIHCDADLYTSTLYFLTTLHNYLKPGTLILFDNFSVATHDFRAFCDYADSYCRSYEVVATAEVDYEKVAVLLK